MDSESWCSLVHLSKKAPVKGKGSISVKSSTKVPEAPQLLPRCEFKPFPKMDEFVSSSLTSLNEKSPRHFSVKRACCSLNDVFEKVNLLNKMFPETEPSASNAHMDFAKREDTVGVHQRRSVAESPVSSFVESVAGAALRLLKSDSIISQMREDSNRMQNIYCLKASDTQLAPGKREVYEQSASGPAQPSERATSGPAQPSEGATDSSGIMVHHGTMVPTSGPVPVQSSNQSKAPTFSSSITPDIEVLEGSGLRDGTCLPLAFIEVKKPAFDLSGAFSAASTTSQTLRSMVTANVIEAGSITPLLLAVAQALFYSLHSVSRYVALCDFNNVIFLQLTFDQGLEVSTARNCKLHVQVSKLYHRRAVLGAYVGFFRYLVSLELERLDEDALWLFAKSISGDGEAKGTSKRKHARRGSNASSLGSTQVALPPSTVSGRSSSSGNANKRTVDPQLSSPSSVVSSSSVIDFATRLEPQASNHIIDHHIAQLDSSDTHFVLKSIFDGIEVIVKFSKRLGDVETAGILEHELALHQTLHRVAGDRCDEIVSRLVAYGYGPEYGLVLVTRFVGSSVERIEEKVCVGGLPVQDISSLSSAAVRSLRVLHSYDVAHGDVALRNMRAKRHGNEVYQVWWIDIGLGVFDANLSHYSQELKACETLFLSGTSTNSGPQHGH